MSPGRRGFLCMTSVWGRRAVLSKALRPWEFFSRLNSRYVPFVRSAPYGSGLKPVITSLRTAFQLEPLTYSQTFLVLGGSVGPHPPKQAYSSAHSLYCSQGRTPLETTARLPPTDDIQRRSRLPGPTHIGNVPWRSNNLPLNGTFPDSSHLFETYLIDYRL